MSAYRSHDFGVDRRFCIMFLRIMPISNITNASNRARSHDKEHDQSAKPQTLDQIIIHGIHVYDNFERDSDRTTAGIQVLRGAYCLP